ncbi:MAG: hypothetical protein ACOYMA_10175 [Bacteroidia bacterium]
MIDNYILVETRNFENGRMIEKRKLNATGEWDEQTFSTELTKRQEAKEENFIFKNKTIISYQNYNRCHKDKYDSYGRVVKMKFFEDGILTSYTEFTYNSPFTKIWCDQLVAYDTPRKRKYSMKYAYNSKGDKIQESCYLPNRDLAWYAVWEYNNQGQITEVLTFNNENVLIYKKIIFYNLKGVKTRKEKFVHKDLISRWKSNSEEIGFCLWTTGA